jgi:hypothetical protein
VLTLTGGRDLFPYLKWESAVGPKDTVERENTDYISSIALETGVPTNQASQYLKKFLVNADYVAKRIPVQVGDGDVDLGTLTMETSKAGIELQVKAHAELDDQYIDIGIYPSGDRSGQRIRTYENMVKNGSCTVSFRPLSPGRYDLVVNERGAWRRDLAQTVARGIEVTSDKIATLAVPLSKGVQTRLQCHLRDWEMVNALESIWVQKEGEDPVYTGDKSREWEVSLLPGAYKFGVTFKDGRSESIGFSVDENTEWQKVDLEL